MRAFLKKTKSNIKDMDKSLLIVCIVLFAFGLLNIVTASSNEAVVRYNASLYNYFFKQLIFLILGALATIAIINIPTKQYRFLGPLLFILVGLSSIYLSMYGVMNKGSKNWIDLGFFSFQPSEFAKPAVIICLSVLFERFYKVLRNKNINHYDVIGTILFVGCFFPIIIFLQKDLGTMLIIFTIFVILFLSSPILRIDKIKTIGLGIILLIIAVLMIISKNGKLFTDAQKSRFDFFDPCSNYENGGYQICNGFIAINDGGLLGVGIGNSKQKSYIPEPHTDSVFAIVAEEYGFIKSSFIFVAFIFVLYRILKISANANTIKGKYICLGIGTYFFLHILINLGGLFGIMPLTGVPLPFLSYGGSFTISFICSLAVVQRIYIENTNKKIKIK